MALTYADLEKLLNPEQLRAATTTEGPLLILAGAGSGKTRVLVHRTAYILGQGLAKPWQIFAVTFTNKAAGEMRERLSHLIGPEVSEAWIGTFHALAARMLRLEGHRLGYTRSFTIYDSDDQKALIRSIMRRSGMDTSNRGTSPNEIAHQIDRAKNQGLLPAAFDRTLGPDAPGVKRLAAGIYKKYQRALQGSNAMDFGDLLMLCVELLKRHPQAGDRFRNRFKYVQVDEFQDTNGVQYELLKQLVQGTDNLAVVGDDDQAIYRWRGAEVTNILDFSKTFPKATVVKLEQNYRSTSTILDAANHVIQRNSRRHAKTLYTEETGGAHVGIAMLPASEDEADVISMVIARRIRAGQSPSDFAILYRQNAQSRHFEETLRRYRVPFVLIGGTGFYERREVKDILAYLRVTANPTSQQDLDRIINVPPRGIGAKTVERLADAGEAAGVSGANALSLSDDDMKAAGLKPAAIKKLRTVGALLGELREISQAQSAEEVARVVIEKTRYEAYLRTSEPATADDRMANVQELVSSIAEHEETLEMAKEDDEMMLGLAGARTPLEAFLDAAALVSPDDTATDGDKVKMLTLHAAKGLEFEVVFLVGMEEQTFPTTRAVQDDSPESMEEERRLCYVGMTRAKRELNLTGARQRRIYGRLESRWPSRFLGELPNHVVGSFPAGGVEGGVPVGTSAPAGGSGPAPDPAPREELPVRDVLADAPRTDSGPLGPGERVFHNTFGEGIVEKRDGVGPRAKLYIRFGDVQKTVIAKFVRAVGDA